MKEGNEGKKGEKTEERRDGKERGRIRGREGI